MKNLFRKYFFLILLLSFSIFFLYLVRGILLPFILGFLIAYLFKNIVKKYQSKIKRSYLSLIFVSTFSFICILIILFIFPMIFSQLSALIKDLLKQIDNFDINRFYSKTKEIMVLLNIENTTELKQYFTELTNFLLKTAGSLTNSLVNSSFQIVNVIFMIFISPIVAFYVLKDWENIFDFLKKEVVPREFRAQFRILSSRIDDVLHHYIVGQLNVCLILGTFYSVLLFLTGFNYSFIVGITAGFLTLLPYVGAFIGGALALTLAYFQFGLVIGKLFSIFFIFCLCQFLEGNFVTPNLIGNKIKVHPLWLIFAILSGGTLYGFWGIVISMPLSAVIGVLVRFYFEKKSYRFYGFNGRQKKINR